MYISQGEGEALERTSLSVKDQLLCVLGRDVGCFVVHDDDGSLPLSSPFFL